MGNVGGIRADHRRIAVTFVMNQIINYGLSVERHTFVRF